MSRAERVLLDGAAGGIEVFVDAPSPESPMIERSGQPPLPSSERGARGWALIAHPHPLFGGTAENKVVTTLAKTLRELGCHTLRPNFRGVGGSAGAHDNGIAETDDLLAVHDYARRRFGDLPCYLAGFSFGAYVVTRLAKRVAATRLILVGTAAGFIEGDRQYDTSAVPSDTIVIHGSADTTVPLANALQWAEPLELPVVVIPGADHFFHRRLHIIRKVIRDAWRP